MIRTQVYLTKGERKALQWLSRDTGKNQSELIRMAVDRLAEQHRESNRTTTLQAARGIWKNRDDLLDPAVLRKEWDRY